MIARADAALDGEISWTVLEPKSDSPHVEFATFPKLGPPSRGGGHPAADDAFRLDAPECLRGNALRNIRLTYWRSAAGARGNRA